MSLTFLRAGGHCFPKVFNSVHGTRFVFLFVLIQVIQVPQGKYKVLPTERTKVSSYPVALIPGQFQEYYKRYMVGFLLLLLVLVLVRDFKALCLSPRSVWLCKHHCKRYKICVSVFCLLPFCGEECSH